MKIKGKKQLDMTYITCISISSVDAKSSSSYSGYVLAWYFFFDHVEKQYD